MKIEDSSLYFTPISITNWGFSVYYLQNQHRKNLNSDLTKSIATLFYAINEIEFDDFIKRK